MKELLTQPIGSSTGKLGGFTAGVVHLVGGVLSVIAGMLVGGGLGYALGLVQGSRVGEQMLGGIAIGAIVGVLRATGYRYALSSGAGALLGWNVAFVLRAYLLAPVAAILGGVLGLLLQRKFRRAPLEKTEQPVSTDKANRPLSTRTVAMRVLGVLAGIVVGGYVGSLVGAQFCMVVFFHAWRPSQLPRTLDQGGLLIFFFGVMGAVIGTVTGARLLYLWVAKRQARHPQPEDVIADYERWKQSHRGGSREVERRPVVEGVIRCPSLRRQVTRVESLAATGREQSTSTAANRANGPADGRGGIIN
ncbi:MAG TPA: hypothetical protein VI136_09685 [Verrucomicrobiae bacterium]